MNRAARRRILFRAPEDYALFLSLLAELPGRFDTRVHGWALMGNHFHLMLEAPDGRLPAAMAWFGGALARKMNAAHRWDGPLFRGRYRNRVVMDDDYWRGLLAYLHLNPARAGLVSRPEDPAWTSHAAYAGLAPPPPWLTRDELLALYGSPEIYREEIAALFCGEKQLPLIFDEALLWKPVNTGGSALRAIPATVATLSEAQALAQVAAITGESQESLRRCVRGRRGNPARALAAWWLVRAAGKSRKEAGECLEMSPLAVGASVSRVRGAEGELGAWRDALMARWWGPMEGPLEGEGME